MSARSSMVNFERTAEAVLVALCAAGAAFAVVSFLVILAGR